LHIAEARADAADRVIAATYRVCKRLAEHPKLGPVRQFPGNEPADIRFFPITEFPNYLVFYRFEKGGVEILRVLHGAQDIDQLFGP
jgi:toxin ParE1/3/4